MNYRLAISAIVTLMFPAQVYGQNIVESSAVRAATAVQVGSALGAAHVIINNYNQGAGSALERSGEEILKLQKISRQLYMQAVAKEKAGQLANACRLYDSYLRIRLDSGISRPGEDNIEDVFCHLSSLYFRLGHQKYAEDLLRAAIAINARMHGPGDSSSVRLLNELAEICLSQHEEKEAVSFYQRSAQIVENGGKNNIVASLEPRTNLARAYFAAGQYQESANVLTKALPLAEENFGASSPKLLPMLSVYGDVLQKLDRGEEALKIEDRVHSIKALSYKKNVSP